jgi:rhodanese-related sulfurtransferase
MSYELASYELFYDDAPPSKKSQLENDCIYDDSRQARNNFLDELSIKPVQGNKYYVYCHSGRRNDESTAGACDSLE